MRMKQGDYLLYKQTASRRRRQRRPYLATARLIHCWVLAEKSDKLHYI